MSRLHIAGRDRARWSYEWPALLLAVVLAVLLMALPAIAARAQPALEPGVDASVHPGDDFFAFANGEWLANAVVPADRPRWSVGAEITAQTAAQMDALYADTLAHPVGRTARRVADFHAAYVNEAAIEVRGLSGVAPLLRAIDRVRDKAGLARLLGSTLRSDVDPMGFGPTVSRNLLGFSAAQGLNGERRPQAFLVQGGLGLPDREYYLSAEPDKQALRIQYRDYLAHLLALSGCDRGGARAEAVVALETAIAQTHATADASALEENANNRWRRADFERKAPGLDWAGFFAAAGLARQEVFIAWQPDAISGAAALVRSQPLAVWKDYLRLRVLDQHADVLPRAFAQAAFALHGTAVNGQAEPAPRAQRAREVTQQALGEGIGRLYVERHFPRAYKARVEAIAADVIRSFGRRVHDVGWLGAATRAQAAAQLEQLYFGVGHPERWTDLSDLDLDPRDALGNRLRWEAWNHRNALERLDRPVDFQKWWLTANTVGAVLFFQQHAYNFPAGLLQPPKFDAAAPSEAMNYGAIGAIVGHEASHFIDTLGKDYDVQGRKRTWWTAEDLAGYASATQPLVDQFSLYRPFPDLALDGRLSLVENLADLGGLAAAFEAHRRALGQRVHDAAYRRQQDRLFFIGFARSWRTKYTEAGLRAQSLTDHPPEMFRIAAVRNIDAWYEAFDVQPGHRLYLAPAQRVRVW